MKESKYIENGAASGVDSSALLAALWYVANNAQRSPNESVRDMCNEAFDICEIPLTASWSSDNLMPIRFTKANTQDSLAEGHSE